MQVGRAQVLVSTQAKQPAVASPSVLVLAPTRELAQQIAAEIQKLKLKVRVTTLYGGVPKGPQLEELKLGADIAIATPGRLLDFLQGDERRHVQPAVSLALVTYLVLDEADRMLDMGFEKDLKKIVAECPSNELPVCDAGKVGLSGGGRQTLLFTATWPSQVQCAAAEFTRAGATQLRIGQGAGGNKLTANTNVAQMVYVVNEHEKLFRLNDILQKHLHAGETAIVFAMKKQTCDTLEQKLWDKDEALSTGTWCRAIHSHREQWERDENLATFRKLTAGKDNGRRGVLVATDVASRGLDMPGVALIVVFDFGGGNLGKDSGVESYVHRIGRTGRAGKLGKAFTFFTRSDSGASKLVALLKGAKQRVPEDLQYLAKEETKRRGARIWHEDRKPGKGGQSGDASWW